MVMVDVLTKITHFIPAQAVSTASKMAKLFLRHIYFAYMAARRNCSLIMVPGLFHTAGISSVRVWNLFICLHITLRLKVSWSV